MFRGVATVLSKLFNVAEPTSAYFGQKDIQQCIVVKRLIKDMLWSIKMNVIPTCREPDGLAMSSRNRFLNDQERKDAPILYESLQKGVSEYRRGITDPKKIIDITLKSILKNPRVTVDYINLSDPETLHDLDVIDKGAIFSGVIRVGKTRILDNILLGMTAQDLSAR
jgi:pantoate--beta-alanine ligase